LRNGWNAFFPKTIHGVQRMIQPEVAVSDPSARFENSLTEDGRYRLLVEAVTDYAIYLLDPSGIVTSWNAGAQRFKGYTAAEIIGQHFSRFYTEEDRQNGVPQRALETAQWEGRFESQGWRTRKDGTLFWAHVVVDPIWHSGELVGYAKITRDLTERKAAEDALRASQEQFKILVQGVTDYAIYMLDTQGRIATWNFGAQRIKGYLPEEIIGHHFSAFYSEEDRKNGEPERALEIAAREGRYEREAWRLRKDGTRFWANVVLDAVRNEDGALIGYAKITRDITERRETQMALEKAREALFQSQKMEAVGQLTGGVAHDFNNLLTAILGSLELVRKRVPYDPKITPLIDNAIQGAQRGTSLTQRMLAFARRQELSFEAVDVQSLVRSMSNLLQTSLGPSVAIEVRFPLVLSRARSDPNQLASALLNLAVNARDAMPNGGLITIGGREESVGIGHRSGLRPARYVCLSVTDTGEGMDEATLAKAAEPFFTTKGVGKGTGLGLAMVHGLAEQSGGRLTLKSQKGQGTTAEIWLPIERAAAHSERLAEHGLSELVKVKRLTILAVDDDSLVLVNTVALLEDLGHTVFSANSAKDALDIFERESIDLIITDHAMPRMTGLQLAQAVQADRPHLPIILASGFAEWPSEIDTLLTKLAKPFRQSALTDAISAALKAAEERSRVVPFRPR
jgi:PAS domain S-box-containing protein